MSSAPPSATSPPSVSASPPESPGLYTPAQTTPPSYPLMPSPNGGRPDSDVDGDPALLSLQSPDLYSSKPSHPGGLYFDASISPPLSPPLAHDQGCSPSLSTSPSAEHQATLPTMPGVPVLLPSQHHQHSHPFSALRDRDAAQPPAYQRGGNIPPPIIPTGFLAGTPPHPSPAESYTPVDGKKEPPELAPWDPAYPGLGHLHHQSDGYGHSQYPLSITQNGSTMPRYTRGIQAAQPGTKFTDSVTYWLGMYFFFNLGLTLFNKVVLVSFPFPYTLTGLHALSGCAGCYIALERGAFTPSRLTQKESLILAAFSVLYTINIAVSNISLQLVTVPVVRAATPLFTIFISAFLLRQKFSAAKLVSLLPVVAGVGFATYGDYYFTAWGLILTLFGTFLAALKTVVTNVIQTGGGGRLKLHPLDLLMRMSPLAFVQCVFYGWYTGELERVRRYGATQMTRSKAIALLVNGVIACGLNIVSFTANKKAGALTMTVSANCKQVLTIALAVFLFNLNISFTNGIGILLTLVGGGWYAYVEYAEKNNKPKMLRSFKSNGR